MKKYNLFKNIENGQKITIVMSGEFGGISVIQTTFVQCTPLEHYVNCPAEMVGVRIVGKPRRKRNLYTLDIDYLADVVVYDGWGDVDTSVLYEIEERNGVTIRKGKYLANSAENMRAIVAKNGAGILADYR